MPMNTLPVPMSDRPPAGPDRGEGQSAAMGRAGKMGRALVMAGLLLPAQDESLSVRATRSALAKLDVDPSRLLN